MPGLDNKKRTQRGRSRVQRLTSRVKRARANGDSSGAQRLKERRSGVKERFGLGQGGQSGPNQGGLGQGGGVGQGHSYGPWGGPGAPQALPPQMPPGIQAGGPMLTVPHGNQGPPGIQAGAPPLTIPQGGPMPGNILAPQLPGAIQPQPGIGPQGGIDLSMLANIFGSKSGGGGFAR